MDPKDFSDAAVPQQNQPTSFEPDRPEFFSDNSAPQPTMTPGSDIQPVSQTPVPQSTVPLPDFMLNRKVPEPTQTPADQKKNLIKLGIIAGIVLVVVLIGYSIFASVMRSKNSDEKILAFMEENSETIFSVDGIMRNINQSKLEVQHLFIESNHESLNELSQKLNNINSGLSKFSPKYANSSINEDLSKVKSTISVLAPAFEKSVALYNRAYAAYIDGNLDPLRELLPADSANESSNSSEDEAMIASVFIEYVEEKASLEKNINTYSCDASAIPEEEPFYDTQSCDYLVYKLDDVVASMSRSNEMIYSIFNAYLDNDITINEDESLSVWINNIITTLEGSTDEE